VRRSIGAAVRVAGGGTGAGCLRGGSRVAAVVGVVGSFGHRRAVGVVCRAVAAVVGVVGSFGHRRAVGVVCRAVVEGKVNFRVGKTRELKAGRVGRGRVLGEG
jgi:hypothetical protein